MRLSESHDSLSVRVPIAHMSRLSALLEAVEKYREAEADPEKAPEGEYSVTMTTLDDVFLRITQDKVDVSRCG